MLKKFLFIIIICQSLIASADDTLRVTLNQADSIFLKKNLSLLAAQYNVSAQKALKLQAKLYPNPNIYVEQSLVNKYTRANYDTDPSRQGNTETIIQIQQLILLAGKRNKQVKLAEIGTKMAEADFENVLRTLKLQLHEDLTKVYYNNESIKLLNEERKSIAELSGNMESQLSNGYVSLNEIVRVKSLLLEIDNAINQYSAYSYNLISEINTILGNAPVVIVKPVLFQDMGGQLLSVTNYIDTAIVHNPEVKTYGYHLDAAKAQYSLNKALAVPDANVQAVYDKSGNYIKNYYGIGLGFQLPAWNRNQGNVKASKFQISQTESEFKQEQQGIAASIVAAYYTLLNNQKMLSNYKADYEKQLLQLMDNVLDNYRKRLITLNEFTNYYDSYRESYLNLMDIKSQMFQNAEQINYLTGKSMIKYQ